MPLMQTLMALVNLVVNLVKKQLLRP